MLLPQAGVFAGNESHLPYDLDDLMVAMAPRPLILITPVHDRFAPPSKADAVEAALRAHYDALGAADKLVRLVPAKYNHFDNTMQRIVLNAIQGIDGK